jgi:uncharacterized protein (DUF302 family)
MLSAYLAPGDSFAISTPNMGLLKAVQNTNLSLWVEALDYVVKEKLANINAEPEVAEAMLNRFNQAMADLEAVIDYLRE